MKKVTCLHNSKETVPQKQNNKSGRFESSKGFISDEAVSFIYFSSSEKESRRIRNASIYPSALIVAVFHVSKANTAAKRFPLLLPTPPSASLSTPFASQFSLLVL